MLARWAIREAWRMDARFTAAHRGGEGPPLVLLHGFTGSWRIWELVLPALERRHEVLAPTLPGHAGGPPIATDISHATVPDAIERAMDAAGFETAHIVGNSLGGYVALQLAARGRARSVVALAPAGGWDDESYKDMLRDYARMHEMAKAAAPHAEAAAATPQGRRQATEYIATHHEHIPPNVVADVIRATAGCDGAPAMIEYAIREPWTLDAERIACPVRIVWGTEDRLLPWPSAAARYRRDWLPHADWVELDGVGHCPQLDVPLETAELILGFS
jgi:pimeloyl-ACP methyl ester carboxylesterase